MVVYICIVMGGQPPVLPRLVCIPAIAVLTFLVKGLAQCLPLSAWTRNISSSISAFRHDRSTHGALAVVNRRLSSVVGSSTAHDVLCSASLVLGATNHRGACSSYSILPRPCLSLPAVRIQARRSSSEICSYTAHHAMGSYFICEISISVTLDHLVSTSLSFLNCVLYSVSRASSCV